jgi:O-antigen ligase
MIFSAFFTFMKMMAYLAILLLVYNMISSTDDLRRLLYFLFLISIPIYLAAYYQFFVMGFLRVWGVFGNPNTMGLYAFTSVGMALALKELKGGANHTKIVVPVWIFLSLTTLILSGSRASILGLAIFGAIYLILNRKYLLLGAAALLVLLGGYYLVHSQTLFLDFARVARLMAGLTGRTIIWETTIDMIRDHPIFGVGPGNVYGLLYTYAQATHPIVSIDLRSAMERGLTHNGYLQQLAEIGVMGLIIALWAVYRFIKYNMAIIRNHGKKSIHKISMVVLALFIGRLVHSFFESDLDIGPFTLEMSVLILYISFIRLNDPYPN